MHVLGASNEKGGVGKTSVFINVGASLAQFHKQRVVILELDRQGSLGEWLVGPDGKRLKEVAFACGSTISACLADPSRAIEAALPTTVDGLDVICADRQLTRAGNAELRAVLDVLSSNYDYALLDFRRDVEESIESVDGLNMRVIVPIRWDAGALTGVAKVLSDMEGKCPVKILFNCVKYRNNETGALVKRDRFGVAVNEKFVPGIQFETKIRDSSLIGDSTNRGIPCVTCHPSDRVSREFKHLCQEVIEWCEEKVA